MKKLFIIMGLAIGGCQSPQTLIVRSDFTVMNLDSTKMWIKDTDSGKNLYEVWKKGEFGNDTKVYLVDSVRFNNLVGKSFNRKSTTVSL